MAKPVLRIIIGSTRPGRVGPSVAAWIADRAREHGGFDVQVTDLAELNLPFLDEPNHPRLRQYCTSTPRTGPRWSTPPTRSSSSRPSTTTASTRW